MNKSHSTKNPQTNHATFVRKTKKWNVKYPKQKKMNKC